jgi:phytoene synthase
LSQAGLTPELAALLPTRARTFAFAAALLPAPQREAVTALYAFCRTIDDLVDEPPPGAKPADVRAALADWRGWLASGLPPDALPEPAPLAEAVRAVARRHDVPRQYLLGLIDGVASDLEPARMPTFAALRRYCVQVAGTVGLAMCHVLGARDPGALAAAVELGVAMQLTNILRDVGADLRAGRIYLPIDELATFGYTPERLLDVVASGERPDDAFGYLVRFQAARARSYYARGMAGVWLLPRGSRAAILLAARLYRAILDGVEAAGPAILRTRPGTSPLRKAGEAAICLLLTALPRDPAPAGRPPESLKEALAWLEP